MALTALNTANRLMDPNARAGEYWRASKRYKPQPNTRAQHGQFTDCQSPDLLVVRWAGAGPVLPGNRKLSAEAEGEARANQSGVRPGCGVRPRASPPIAARQMQNQPRRAHVRGAAKLLV
eukprot:1188071-Prorocentrum_minimum.AAC.2